MLGRTLGHLARVAFYKIRTSQDFTLKIEVCFVEGKALAGRLAENFRECLYAFGNCKGLGELAETLARETKDPVSIKKWTYNTNLAYARIRVAVEQGNPSPARKIGGLTSCA
jgi:hypothetical protein